MMFALADLQPAPGSQVLDHTALFKSVNVGMSVHYRSVEFRGVSEHQLQDMGTIGFRGGFGPSLLQVGFGIDIGFADPRGRLLRDTIPFENPTVGVGSGYLTAALLLPLRVTVLAPYVDAGITSFSIYDRRTKKDVDLGGGGYWEYGLRTLLPFDLGDDGVHGLSIGFGHRRYSAGNPHHTRSATVLEVGYTGTGWLIHGK